MKTQDRLRFVVKKDELANLGALRKRNLLERQNRLRSTQVLRHDDIATASEMSKE